MPACADDDPFAGRSLADLETELARRHAELEHMREVYPESLAIPIVERRINALNQAIGRQA